MLSFFLIISPLLFFIFWWAEEERSDFVAVQFGEFAQHRQGEDEPFAQRRFATELGNVHQTVGGTQSVTVDVSYPILGDGRRRGRVGRQDDLGVIFEKVDLKIPQQKLSFLNKIPEWI